MATKYTLATLPMNDAEAAIDLVKRLAADGKFTYEAAQMLQMSMVTGDQQTLYDDAMAELNLEAKPKTQPTGKGLGKPRA